MSYSAAIEEIESTVEALTGMTYVRDKRIEDLQKIGHFGEDGAFFVILDNGSDAGPHPWPELSTGPVHWWCWIRVEMIVPITTDVQEQEKTVITRGMAIIEALRWGALTSGCIYDMQQPRRQRNQKDRRIVWSCRFKLRYTDT